MRARVGRPSPHLSPVQHLLWSGRGDAGHRHEPDRGPCEAVACCPSQGVAAVMTAGGLVRPWGEGQWPNCPPHQGVEVVVPPALPKGCYWLRQKRCPAPLACLQFS